jgi:hypothetical protein
MDIIGRAKPKLLDLYCKAGGSSRGYQLAGFHVTGVDIEPQPRYAGNVFVQADALDYVAAYGHRFDAIAASPPCQGYSVTAVLPQCWREYPKLVEVTRFWLETLSVPYIIENVIGAPMQGVTLCGLMFGLKVFRHRLFESNVLLLQPAHISHKGHRIGLDGMCCVAGHGDAGKNVKVDKTHRRKSAWEAAMEIDWMLKRELTQAIPPAYTHYLGQQLLRAVEGRAVRAEPWDWRVLAAREGVA